MHREFFVGIFHLAHRTAVEQVQAEAQVNDSEARTEAIRQESDEAIVELRDRIKELEAESAEKQTKNEEAMGFFHAQIAQLEQARDQQISEEREEKNRVLEELEAMSAELSTTRGQLQQEISERSDAEREERQQTTSGTN